MKRAALPAVRCLLILSLAVVTFSSVAEGAGFALIEQSVSGLGNAYAGGAAGAEDASTIFFNPAGLARLSGSQVILAGFLVMPSAKFTNEGSTYVLQPVTGMPLLGDNSHDAGLTKGLANIYLSKRLSDKITVGLGINSPFGLATKYDDTWVGRYYAINSELMTLNISPSIAYRFNEHLSIGAGINAQYVKATLSNAIDFGTLDALGAFKPLPALGLKPQGADGYAEVKGDGWDWGYTIGILYEFTGNTRIGATYRSRVNQTLKGDVNFTNVPAALNVLPVFKNCGVTSYVTLPDSLSASIFHQINPEWAVMGDITWTNWSVFNELRIQFDNPAQADSVITTQWDDSYRYSLGLTYTPKNWAFRIGAAYDQTPIPDAQHRTPRIPDGDRFWLAFGIGYKISNNARVDAGYAHLFVKDPEISKTPTGEDTLRGGLNGTYSAHVNIVGAQFLWTF